MLEVAIGKQTVGRKKFLRYFPSSEVVWGAADKQNCRKCGSSEGRELSSKFEELLSLNLSKCWAFHLGQARVF
jgi:hypothetical protein